VDDPIGELLARGVELRFVRSLWHLRDSVVASSLQFSLIRMRNALPRKAAEQADEPESVGFGEFP